MSIASSRVEGSGSASVKTAANGLNLGLPRVVPNKGEGTGQGIAELRERLVGYILSPGLRKIASRASNAAIFGGEAAASLTLMERQRSGIFNGPTIGKLPS